MSHVRSANGDRGVIQSVNRAIDLLEALSAAGGEGLQLSGVARQVGLLPSTAYRLLATLAGRGYVRQEPQSRRYALGPVARLLLGVSPNLDGLVRLAMPHLGDLARASGETANLAILRNMSVVFVDQIASGQLVRAVPQLNVPLPMHATAAGKALLACLPAHALGSYLNRPRPAFTRNTLASRQALEAALAETHLLGYAVDREELDEGGRCVAATVRGLNVEPIAALTITGPTSRMTSARLRALGRLVQRAAKRLSRELQAR